MARIDRARLNAATFPVTIELQTRFDDLDVQGHVNNAAVSVLLQEARVLFNRASGMLDHLAGRRMVVVAIQIEFAAELLHPMPVTIDTGLLRIGRTSFAVGQVVRQNGRSAVYAEVTMAFADDSGAVPVPEPVRAGLARLAI